jgi:diketogulonate reductase-like aldo/keto reductase
MISPASVPSFTLASGAKVPAIGIGTFGSDRYSPAEVAGAVEGALRFGYRHVDCAAVYGNEAEIGAVLRGSGVPREELWITSKLWNDRHGDAVRACEESLARLGLEYLDLYLVHWPVPNFHAPKVDVEARDPDARPFILAEFMKTWRQLEELVHRGLVRHIGTSNVTVSKLRGILGEAEIKPAANEMELHPHFQQPELFDFVRGEGILPIGYCPLGSPGRPERDRTPEDTVDLEDSVILQIAAAHGLSPAQVCIRWAIQRGQLPIPFSVKPHQYESSLAAAVAAPLTQDEMRQLAGIDRGCRLIKGQVFLWPGAKDWTALWED